MNYNNDRFSFPKKLFDDIASEIESSYLNEYQNQDELMEELNIDYSHIDFDPSVLFQSRNDSNTDITTKDSILNKKRKENLK